MLRSIFITADDGPPLADLAGHIWGINIIRTRGQVAAAPPPVGDGYRKIRQLPPYSIRCGACGNPMHRARGLAVLRLRGLEFDLAPIGLCMHCMREPRDAVLTRRVHKRLTGVDRDSVDWKESLQ